MSQDDSSAVKSKLVIVDGNGLAYRAFYALPIYRSFLGMPVNAICGFVRLLFNVIYAESPTHIVVAFDHSAYTERMLKYQAYNVQRDEMPSDLAVQIPIIEDFVRACGFAVCRVPGFEADDCIGTLVRKACEANMKTIIVSGDLELLQLVRPNVSVFTTRRGIGDTIIYNEEAVKAAFKLEPRQLGDLRALAGDSSQNIGGIPGIGSVTACRLLSQYDSLDELYENLNRLPAKWRNPLRENYDMAMEFRARATIRTDLPIDLDVAQCKFSGIPVKMFSRVFELLGAEFEFGGPMLDRLREMASEELPSRLPERTLSAEEARQALKEVAEGEGPVAMIQLCRQGIERGLGVAELGKSVFYLECAPGDELTREEVWQLMAPILSDEKRVKYVYRGVGSPRHREIVCRNVVDVGLASALLHPEIWNHSFEDICRRHGLVTYDSRLLFGFGDTDWENVPQQNRMCWTGCAAHVLSVLGPIMVQSLKDNGLWDIFQKIDIPFSQACNDCVIGGIAFDSEDALKVKAIIEDQMESLRRSIYDGAGFEFDFEDDKELGDFLFVHLGLLVPTRPKSGDAITEEILAALEGQHPLVTEIRKYRELVDFVKIYVQKFFLDGQVEFEVEGSLFTLALMAERRVQAFNKTAMAGPGVLLHRLISIVDNMLSIDVRQPLREAVRRTVRASDPDRCLAMLSFRQIALRVLAHLSGDEELLAAINEGGWGQSMAQAVFGLPAEEVTIDHRRSVSLMVYRYMSPIWMARRLGVTESEASDILANFDKEFARRFPTGWQFLQNELAKARRMEPLSTIAGRRRVFVEASSRVYDIRESAERHAMMYAVEGTITDIFRKVISELHQRLDGQVRMLPVFDGVTLELNKDGADEVIRQVIDICAECTYGISIPIRWNKGDNWYEASSGLV